MLTTPDQPQDTTQQNYLGSVLTKASKTQLKQRKCKVCRNIFTKTKPLQSACSIECALQVAYKTRDKLIKAQDKVKREKLKSRADWLKEAQTEVNKYVRLRDSHLGCVSCDKPATWDGQWHASHFRSVGAASSIRFNLWNINKSCSICNNWKSGNLSDYEPRLIKKIGKDKVEWLRSQNHLANYSIEYLKRLKQVIHKRLIRLEKRHG